jgi:hypothetical protein
MILDGLGTVHSDAFERTEVVQEPIPWAESAVYSRSLLCLPVHSADPSKPAILFVTRNVSIAKGVIAYDRGRPDR